MMMKRWAMVCLVLMGLAIAGNPMIGFAEDTSTIQVKSKRKPADPWKEYPTRTLDQLHGLDRSQTQVPKGRFGGRTDKISQATGFFYPKQIDGRWWLIDPDGYAFIHIAVVSVNQRFSPGVNQTFEQVFGSGQTWAETTTSLLREHGFNGTGNWSDIEALPKANHPLIYTCGWNFMSGFGGSKKLTYQKPGHRGYPNDCILVFHPEFESYCDQYAVQLSRFKDDPNVLGHFSDNELPLNLKTLDNHLQLDASNPDLKFGFDAAWRWLQDRKGDDFDPAEITDDDREAFRGFVTERYLKITTEAMRRNDPNHLMLGPRLHGSSIKSPAIFAACGKYLDVVAVNYYNVWTPEAKLLADWQQWSRKPVMITEWYTKGADAGYENHSGAGWIVPTQADRGRFYQNYVLTLLESKSCVGWHWFKYMDNDPADLTTDPSNRDSNKGIVTIRFTPYKPLLDRMKQVNEQVYGLIDFFDSE